MFEQLTDKNVSFTHSAILSERKTNDCTSFRCVHHFLAPSVNNLIETRKVPFLPVLMNFHAYKVVLFILLPW